MRVMATGGGTGGHVYPALSVIEVLTEDGRWGTRREDVVWVGSSGGMEEQIVRRAGIRFEAVPTGALLGAGLVTVMKNSLSVQRGVKQARELIKQFRPQVVLATGGYVSAPLVLAARRSCPVLIYLPDMHPGLAVRHLGRYARRIAVSFEAVARYFPAEKVVVSGYPVRKALHRADKRVSRLALGLGSGQSFGASAGPAMGGWTLGSQPSTAPEERVLLVLGGSRGAHSINEAVRQALPELLALTHVFHISGTEDFAALRAVGDALPVTLRSRYHLYAYVYEQMTDLLAAADLVVARAGAATLGEFPAVGLPSILVPYPYAGQHQELNAAYLREHGAARLVYDRDLETQFLSAVRELMGDARQLDAMSAAARSMAAPGAAECIAGEMLRLAGTKD